MHWLLRGEKGKRFLKKVVILILLPFGHSEGFVGRSRSPLL